MEVESRQPLKTSRAEAPPGHSQARSGSTGIVERDPHLRVLRVDPHAAAHLPAAPGDDGPEPVPLVEGIENEVVGIAEELVEFRIPVTRRVDVDLLAKLLPSESGLIDGARRNAAQVTADPGKEAEHGESLEGQDDPAPGSVLNGLQDRKITLQGSFVHHVGGSLDSSPIHILRPSTGVEGAHVRNRSVQGSPYCPSFSMKGSGSSSSTLKTPWPRHRPVSIIMAPIMAGTPVV